MHTGHFLIALSILLSGSQAAADDDAWRAARLWVVGGDGQAWVAGASQPHGEEPSVVRMWFLGAKVTDSDALPKPSRFLPPVSANPVRIGADADGLRVLLSNMATWNYFPDRAAIAGDLWTDHCRRPPLAWAGDASKPILWALVKTDALITPQAPSASQPTSATSSPAEPELRTDQPDGESAQATARPAGLTLLQLRGGFWRRLAVLNAAEEGQSFWLAGREGTIYLFWQISVGEVRFAQRRAEAWSIPQIVTSDPEIVTGWAGADQRGPVFIAGRGTSTRAVQLHLYLRSAEGWSSVDAAREGSDYLTLDAAAAGVGVTRGRLAVARIGRDGRVEFGWGELRTSPLLRFGPLSMRVQPARPKSGWGDAILTGLVIGVLTLVMFTRREQVNRPAVVPRGFVIAPPWRRIIATAVDIAPAMLVVMPWTMSMLPIDDPAALLSRFDDPELSAKMLPMNIAFLSLYGLWCFVWELTTGTTPGKRIFACRVLSADGTAPTTRQILARNILRVITVALGPPTWMVALMLMLMLTRNRQRLGDLLGNTIVIQPGVGPQPPRARPIHRDDTSDRNT